MSRKEMSQSKRQSRVLDDDEEGRSIAEQQDEVRKITAQLRRRGPGEEERKAAPTIIGWKPSCPHCGKPIELIFHDNGTYELSVRSS